MYVSPPSSNPNRTPPPFPIGLTTRHGRGSFCGNEYDKWGEVTADDDRACDMVLVEDSSVEAGGYWAMSVYQLEEMNVELNSGSGSSNLNSADIHGNEGTGAGGTTDVGETTLEPVASGQRAFTVVNKCSSTIRVGSTGGR